MNPIVSVGLIGVGLASVFACWLGWQLLRQNGRILLRLEALEQRLEKAHDDSQYGTGLPICSPAPEFELPDLGGNRTTLAGFLGRPLLLIFFDPACGFCRDLAQRLASNPYERRAPRIPEFLQPVPGSTTSAVSQLPLSVQGQGVVELSRPRLLLVSTGEAKANQQLLDQHQLDCPVLLQKEMEVAESYQAFGTPSGYLINAEGRIASELAIGAETLLELASGKAPARDSRPAPDDGERRKDPVPQKKESSTIRNANSGLESVDAHAGSANNGEDRVDRFSKRSLERSKLKRDGLKAGTPAPDFRLPRLEGGELSLTDLRGRPVLLVFSSPRCGPCDTLAPRLEQFRRKHQALQVVMISRGEPGENREKVRAHGLTFPVVLQKQWEISRLYAIFATPVAYLIDRGGVITAEVAVGVEQVLELMTRAVQLLRQEAGLEKPTTLKRLAHWPVARMSSTLHWLTARLMRAQTACETFELRHFKFVPRPDDIFIVTYPRSGTTWMQMILYQLTTDGSMGFSHIAEHSPWFERSPDSDRGYEERPGPRVFKSHLPFGDIPKGPGRYIYVARDGRDVAVSYYNLYRSHNGYRGTFPEFFELFMRGEVMFGSWFDHVGGWWQHRHELNVLFLTYEELMSDLEGCLRRIIAFCHLPVPEERLPLILERCSFAFMKAHESKFDPAVEALWQQGARLNLFLRAGRVGQGSRQLSLAQRARFDQACREQLDPAAFAWPTAGPLRQPVPVASVGPA